MNLPIRENAVVWQSDLSQFRAVHKEDKEASWKLYTDAFNALGFIAGEFETDATGAYTSEFRRGPEKFGMRVYDFENTGVVIQKK